MEEERSSRMSPYNTVMNTELKISVRENISVPASGVNGNTAINCNAKLSNIPLINNPYSEIQVLTSPPEQRPTHLPAPVPVPTIPSRNMSTDQFLSLLNQLITSQEPAVSGYQSDMSSPLPVPQESNENLLSAQNHSFRLNRDFSIEPIALQQTGTRDDMQTLPSRRESEEKRASLSKSFSVPSLLNLTSLPTHNLSVNSRYDAAKHESADSIGTPSLAPIDPPKLVCGPQTADQLPPGVLQPLAHSLLPPLSLQLQASRQQQQQPDNAVKDYPPSQPLPTYTLPQPTFHHKPLRNTGHTSDTETSRDLLGQLELLKKREQMLQTAKMQLEEKCAALIDKVDTMETKEHRLEHELESLLRIRCEQDQKNIQLEQYNQLLQQQLENSRQHVTQLDRRIEGLIQQCRLKDEANSQNSELYQKLEAADKMINVFQERLDSSRLQLSQQEALINSLDTRARSAETALVQSQQDTSALSKDRTREKERYNQELQRVQAELQTDKQRREQEMMRVRNQLIQENEKFKEEYNRLREEYDGQKNKFDRLLEEFRLTQTELERKQNLISELELESRDKQSELSNLKAAVSKYESMEDNYKRTLMRKEEDIRHLQHTNNRLHNLGSMQTTFQGQSDAAKFQYNPTSPQMDSPSSYPRTPAPGPGYSRHWTDPSADIQREIRSSSSLADPISSAPRTTAPSHVWPSDSESDYPDSLVRAPSDRGAYDTVKRQHSSHKDKLNFSFDLTYPKDCLPSQQQERVKAPTSHSEPRKRMAWITEEPDRETGNGISDEEKYKMLLALDQNNFNRPQVYKGSRSSSYTKPEKPSYTVCLDKVSEIEEMYDRLQGERQLLESALNRGSGRASRQSRQKREDIETRLEDVMKELGSVRMKLRMLGILKS